MLQEHILFDVVSIYLLNHPCNQHNNHRNILKNRYNTYFLSTNGRLRKTSANQDETKVAFVPQSGTTAYRRSLSFRCGTTAYRRRIYHAVATSEARLRPVAGLRRGEGRLRKPTGGLRHAVGSLRRTEGGEGENRTHGPFWGQQFSRLSQ